MAKLTFDGVDELIQVMVEMATLPDDVAERMLNAEAEVVIKAQKSAAPKKTGTLGESISGRAMGRGASGRYKDIYPKGINHTVRSGGVRNAEVAFIHEFGAPGRNIPETKWMERANESAADEALNAAAEVYGEWIESL